jgi:hypothetical protein
MNGKEEGEKDGLNTKEPLHRNVKELRIAARNSKKSLTQATIK